MGSDGNTYDREPGIESLLNQARDAAIHAFDGKPAIKANLDGMAAVAKQTIWAQAEFGMWKTWCITEGREFDAVKCYVEFNPTFGIKAPIQIHWDFSRTALRHLVAETAPSHLRSRA